MEIIPFDKRDGKIWFDGQLIDWKDATIHVLNHGLHYASAVFEGVRSYNGNIFKNDEHNQRLIDSAAILDFKIPYSKQQLNLACQQVLEANNLTNAYLRPIAWRGSEMLGIDAKDCKTHVAIAAWEWGVYYGEKAMNQGLRLAHAHWKRPAPDTAPVHSKSSGLYMIATVNKMKATEQGYDDALMLDYKGDVAETCSSNVFFVFDGELHTPTPSCFLDGITRRTAMDLAKKRGVKIVERIIKLEELKNATEGFVTGTAAEITPIGSIGDDINFEVGELTKNLINDYRKLTC